MKLASFVLGGALLLATSWSANAQAILDGSQVDEILKLALGHGSATLETQSSGDPRIAGSINGIMYQAFFLNCTDNTACEDINFYAGFLDNKPTMDAMNAWNRDKRFGNAYLDVDLDAVIEYDINLEHGVTRENLDASFSVWSMLLDQFAAYIDYKAPAN